jgi:hypothetical protein
MEGDNRGIFDALSRDLAGGSRENHKKSVRVAGVPVEISTRGSPVQRGARDILFWRPP